MSKCLCYAAVNNPFESHAFLSLKTFIFHFYLDAGKGGRLFSSSQNNSLYDLLLSSPTLKNEEPETTLSTAQTKKYSLFHSL